MGLAWELHELIQDFVDGKLSPERAHEVQTFLDKHPIAQQVADQYRQVTQPEFDALEVLPAHSSLADRVMASIDKAPWYAIFKKPSVIVSLSLVVALPVIFWLTEPLALLGWIQTHLLEAFSPIDILKRAVTEVSQRVGTVSPFLIASILIAGFWGMVDRLIRLAHRAKQA